VNGVYCDWLDPFFCLAIVLGFTPELRIDSIRYSCISLNYPYVITVDGMGCGGLMILAGALYSEPSSFADIDDG
jgi:hypothetical protein